LELNGLMFRQMSGRAGRRGFDLLGQVVFLDMSFLKVRRLIASDLTTLTGEFQLSPTTLLRVLRMWETISVNTTQAAEAERLPDKERILPRSKEEIANNLAPMYSLPFFRSLTAELDMQVAYHTRFSLEFLRKEGLIDDSGVPMSLSSMVTHLFEVEPANFILARLLSSGLLHKYLKEEEPKVIKGIRSTHLTVKLTGVLAWFLFRRRLPHCYAKSQKRKKWQPSEACPALPALPTEILEEVQKYNGRVFELFQSLSWSVASTRKFGAQDYTLPVSERSFPTSWDERGAPFLKESDFQKGYIGQLIRFRARSPLAGISGSGDRFTSPSDLVNCVRNVIQMDLNALPIIPPAMVGGVENGLEVANSWALDFMIHGKLKYLWEDNGIDATLSYKLISSLKEQISMAVQAMKAYSPASGDIVLQTFELLHEQLNDRLVGDRTK